MNQAAENGNTPLHAAVNTGKMHLVSLLLHYPGINVNIPNQQCDGASALHLAVVYGNSSDFWSLKKFGAKSLFKLVLQFGTAHRICITLIYFLIRLQTN